MYSFRHERVDKSIRFANGKVYISYAKERLLKFHRVSRENFMYYLKELEFRYSNRENLDEEESPKIKREKYEGITYTFVVGEKDGQTYMVVWREYSQNWTEEDYKKDRDFIEERIKAYEPRVVYVNGQYVLTPEVGNIEIRDIDSEFKRLIWS